MTLIMWKMQFCRHSQKPFICDTFLNKHVSFALRHDSSRDTPPCCSITGIRIYLHWLLKQILKPCLCSNSEIFTEVQRQNYAASALKLQFLLHVTQANQSEMLLASTLGQYASETIKWYRKERSTIKKGLRKYAVQSGSSICCLRGTAQQNSKV